MKRRISALAHGVFPVLGLVLGLGLATPALCLGQGKSLVSDADLKTQEELEYANRLIELGLPDFADMVLKKIGPSAGPMLKVLKIRGLLMRGKFDDVKPLIAAESGDAADAMKLALADGLFTWGRYPEAQRIYMDFFSKYPQGPSEAMNKFYMEAAYRYGQMLLFMKKDREAVDAYKLVLKAKLEKSETRQMMGEMAEILLKMAEENPSERGSLLPQVQEIVGRLMWTQDLWWGKAVVFQAHIKMMQGDVAGAMKIIDDYREQLTALDNQLKDESEKQDADFTKLSPMAQVRFMVASMQLKEAEKLVAAGAADREKIGTLLVGPRGAGGARDMEKGALLNFYEVFISYPRTPWAPQAGKRAKQVKKMLEDLGAKPNISISDEKWNEVAKVQFIEARSLFSQAQYAAALENYYSIINIFAESEMSVDALGEMVRCYVELANEDTPIYAPMLAGYLAERFCGNSNLAVKAGEQLMRVAELFGEKGNQAAKDATYKQFFTLYPGHAQAPGVQFRFGEQEFKKENYVGALGYFKEIAEKYPHLTLSLDAINRVASCYSRMEDLTNEVVALKAFMSGLEKHGRSNNIMMLDAQNRQAYATWKLGGAENQVAALKQFHDLITLLNSGTYPGSNTEEDRQRGEGILESAMFFKAVAFGSLRDPPDRVKDYRAAAIKGFADLIKRFPKSKHAPRALSQTAALLFADGEPAKATDMIRQIEKDYPDSPEAKNSTYIMAVSLMEMGFREQALRYFREMFSGKGTFNDAQIYSASSELFKAKPPEYELALGGFDRVASNSVSNRSLHEPALLGKGKCLVELGRYQEGVASLSAFTNMYLRSMNLIDAGLYLSRSYSELATVEPDRQKRIELFNMGVRALKDVSRYEKSEGGRARLLYEQGRMQELRATAEEKNGTPERAKEFFGLAMAAYQSLIITYNASDAVVAQWMQKADVQCIPLLIKMGHERDAFDNCETHIKRFGKSSPDLQKIRSWRNELRATLVSRGESIDAPPDAEAPPDTNVTTTATGDATATTNAAVTVPAAPTTAVETTTNTAADVAK